MILKIDDLEFKFSFAHTKLAKEILDSELTKLKCNRRECFFVSDELPFQPLTFRNNMCSVNYLNVGDVCYLCDLNRIVICFDYQKLDKVTNIIYLGNFCYKDMVKDKVDELLRNNLSNIGDTIILEFN